MATRGLYPRLAMVSVDRSGDAAVSFGVLDLAKAAGDLLFDLTHTQIPFGAVVRERDVRVAGEQ